MVKPLVDFLKFQKKQSVAKTLSAPTFAVPDSDLGKLTFEDVKFIFDQAEKALKEISESAKDLAGRTIAVIGVTSGALVGIVAYAFTKFQTNKIFDEAICTCCVTAIYLTILAYRLVLNYRGQDYLPIGTEPRKLLIEKVTDVPNEERKTWFYVAEIKRNQNKITYNRNINNKRWSEFNQILIWLSFTPLVAGCVYAFYTIT